MPKKAYVEITNECNLRCAFCPGTRRAKRAMAPEDFARVLDALQGRVEYLYLHLMGEPLLHPEFPRLLALAREREMKLCLTTNGTLLPERSEALLQAENLYRVAVSLHCIEENGGDPARSRRYLEGVWNFAVRAAARGVIVALRLWNEGAADAGNGAILDFLREKTGRGSWDEPRARSFRLADRLYLEREAAFDWPDLGADERTVEFCRALREQIGVLADGTVVPCCLDHEGDLALGNLLREPLDAILASPRARALYEGFSRRAPSEELCRRCGYAMRFNQGAKPAPFHARGRETARGF